MTVSTQHIALLDLREYGFNATVGTNKLVDFSVLVIFIKMMKL